VSARDRRPAASAERVVGESPGVRRARDQVRRAAQSGRAAVLLVGEPGTGRGLLARELHRNAPWSGDPFRETTPEGLLRDEMPGRVGTLVVRHVDEDSDPAREAVRRHFAGAGGPGPAPATATGRGILVGIVDRVPAALGGPTGPEVIPVPPLREREGDLALLVDHYLRNLNREHGRRVTGITRGALAHLERHDWPGNVRELRTALEGMVVFATGRRPLDVSDLPLHLRERAREHGKNVTLPLGISLAEAEKSFLEETLRAVGYDRPRAAETLGIGLRTLYRKLKEYEIG
jgi:transcriptional regulator with PAS, ATPase and Fis domain